MPRSSTAVSRSTPGVVNAGPARAPARAEAGQRNGPLVSSPGAASDALERVDVATSWTPGGWDAGRWSCRAGVCHTARGSSREGGGGGGGGARGRIRPSYGPEPLDPPAQGNLLVCCSRPAGDIVIDL